LKNLRALPADAILAKESNFLADPQKHASYFSDGRGFSQEFVNSLPFQFGEPHKQQRLEREGWKLTSACDPSSTLRLRKSFMLPNRAGADPLPNPGLHPCIISSPGEEFGLESRLTLEVLDLRN
jgi:hypothetical protein